MAASDNRVPRTYRKLAFIPDGYVDVLGALSIVGKALFGDKWTGEEVADRRGDEAQQRRDQAVQRLQQGAFAGTFSSKILTKGGTDHDLPKRVWADDTAWQIFDRGWAGFAEMAGYLPVTLEGHVLFCERELTSASLDHPDLKPSRKTTLAAQKKCQVWLEGLMRAGGPTKNRGDYQAEAIATYDGLSKKGFLRAWGNAVAEVGETSWIKSGPKSKSA